MYTRTAEVFDALLQSGDFGRVVVPIVRLYLAYFNRPPDHSGMSYWLERHARGSTLEDIAEAFGKSREFARRCAAMNDANFVLHVFRSMFGHDPGAARRAPWVHDLAAGRVRRGELVHAFSHSPDFHAHVACEVHAAVMYLLLLGRTPDPAGFVHWATLRRSGASALGQLVHSDEFRSRWIVPAAARQEG
jgi:hypothetical protein